MQIYYSVDSESISGTVMTINGTIYQSSGAVAAGLIFSYTLGTGDLAQFLLSSFDGVAAGLGVIFAIGDQRVWIGLGLPISTTQIVPTINEY